MANGTLGFFLGGTADRQDRRAVLAQEQQKNQLILRKQISDQGKILMEQFDAMLADPNFDPVRVTPLAEEFFKMAQVHSANEVQVGLPGTTEAAMRTKFDTALSAQQQAQLETQRKIEGAQAEQAAGTKAPPDRYEYVPNVGLVDLSGDTPQTVLPVSEIANAKSRYTNVAGVGLVDLLAEGGPAVTIPSSKDPSVQKVIAPLLEKLARGESLSEGEQAAIDIYQRATTTDLLLREALAGFGEDIPTPKTQEEYDAIPKGTRYQHPDDPPGQLRTKK